MGQAMLGQTISFTLTGVASWDSVNLGGSFGSETATRIDLSVNYKNSLNQTVTVANVPVFCTDLYQPVGFATYTDYTVIAATVGAFPLSGSNSRVDVSRLLALQYLFGTAFGTASNYFNTVSTTWPSYQLAGFQTALWEIVHDDYRNNFGNYDFSLNTGMIQPPTTTDPAVMFASDLLSSVRANIAAGQGPKVDLVVLSSVNNQDLIMAYTPVPEPSTYAFAGAASLLGLAAYRRRKAAKAKQAA